MKRYAVVRGRSVTAEKVAAYLPSNYQVIGESNSGPLFSDHLVVIQGEDDHGWTLDGYVIPRLGSGLMRADEVDLSHPAMKEISL